MKLFQKKSDGTFYKVLSPTINELNDTIECYEEEIKGYMPYGLLMSVTVPFTYEGETKNICIAYTDNGNTIYDSNGITIKTDDENSYRGNGTTSTEEFIRNDLSDFVKRLNEFQDEFSTLLHVLKSDNIIDLINNKGEEISLIETTNVNEKKDLEFNSRLLDQHELLYEINSSSSNIEELYNNIYNSKLDLGTLGDLYNLQVTYEDLLEDYDLSFSELIDKHNIVNIDDNIDINKLKNLLNNLIEIENEEEIER